MEIMLDWSQKTTGQRIRLLREYLSLNQSETVKLLADRGVEIGRSRLSRIENSDRPPPSEIVAALSVILQTTSDFLLLLTDDPSTPEDYMDEIAQIDNADFLVKELADIYTTLGSDGKETLMKVAKALRNSEPRIIE